jgi:dTDP-4-dehydrorhamnose 3,5-epimerase
MIFKETPIRDVYLVDIERLSDIRGFFARIWCEREFAEHGIQVRIVQASVSFNRKKGTLRGLHYQAPPSREGKFVRCARGMIFSVVVDLRPVSPTFTKNYTAVLTMDNHSALYVAPGVAFGFQTLVDDTEVLYQMTDFYNPEYARGFRWNDPAFDIPWPQDERIILDRDKNYPDFDPQAVAGFTRYYP